MDKIDFERDSLTFSSLKTSREISRFLGISYENLTYYLYRSDYSKRYKEFSISKKSGGDRKILSPTNSIKYIQTALSRTLQALYMTMPKASCHGFILKKSIVTNAKLHIKKRYVLNIDLIDFFPSINFGRVRGMFQNFPFSFNDEVSTVLAQVCCHENQLPQGAPTSPIVSNFICRKMDSELQGLAKKYKLTYSRYADDMSFSTFQSKFPEMFAKKMWNSDRATIEVSDSLEQIIHKNGFQVNLNKVRLLSPNMRQEVTGLTVNEFPNVKRNFIRQIRTMLYALERFGPELAEKRHYEIHRQERAPFKDDPSFVNILKGKIEFLRMVRGANDLIFIKYFNKYVKACPELGLELIDTPKEKLKKALWILEGEKGSGTGFYLKGVGLVTCDHVLDKDTKIFQTHNLDKTYEFKVVIINHDYDIAILEIMDFESLNFLEAGNSDDVRSEDPITLYGFPNYGRGNEPTITPGVVTKIKLEHGVERIFIDAKIWEGNSGGPALDERNKVIGIAFKGKGEVENQITPINCISKLAY